MSDDSRGDDRHSLQRRSGGAEPCAVYGGGANALGRVTTPLGDLRFTNLFGGPVAMARQLGRQSSTDISEGALPIFNEFISEVAGDLVPDPLFGAGKLAIGGWMSNRLRRAIPAEYLNMLRAYGEGGGIDAENLVVGQMAWDLWAVLMGAPLSKLNRAASRARNHSPLFGSATVVLPGPSGPLHLRWLDNAAVDRWDRKASVAFFHPDRGIPYALVASVGLITGLPAGMNAAGLVITVEADVNSDIDWSGKVVGQVMHRVLSQAQTIEEAAALLRQYPTLVSWRYVLSEGDRGRTAVFYSRQGELELRPDQAFFVSGCDASVMARAPAHLWRWHKARKQALSTVVGGWNNIDEDWVYRALQAMVDERGDDPGLTGHPLAMASNVGAVLFEPSARRLWVAAGRAPTARRWFVPMSLRSEQAAGGGLDTTVRPLKPSPEWANTNAGRALGHLRQAYQRHRSGEEPERILILLEHALALDRKRPTYHILAGLMALRVHRARRAAGAFERALELIADDTWRTEVELYMAWALDLKRQRKAARTAYARVAKDPATDETVRKLARRGRRRKFREGDARNLEIDFFVGSAV